MKNSISRVFIVAAVLVGSTVVASAQGGSTDPRGNAIGPERAESAGDTTSGGAMREAPQGTTGMNVKRSEQDNSNGSPSAPPTSKQGPGGDPSKNNDAPK